MDENTSLYVATEENNLAAVEQIIKKGFNDFNKIYTDGNTVLMKAVIMGHNAIAAHMIKVGADVNISNEDGFTAIFWAAYDHNQEATDLLLANGANFNVHTKWNDSAFFNLDLEHLTRVIEATKNIDSFAQDGWTSLMNAIVSDYHDLAVLIVSKGADLDIRNEDGNTALILSAEKHNTALALLLIEKGADIHIDNNAGQTALVVAAEKSNHELGSLLLKKGAVMNIQKMKAFRKMSVSKNDIGLQQLLERAINEMQNAPFSLAGVTLVDINEFIERCGGEAALKSKTTADVVESFVKLYTSHSESYCETLCKTRSKKPVQANTYVVHAWGSLFLETVNSLKSLVLANVDKGASAVFWIDIFCTSQHVSAIKDMEWWTKIFKSAIKSIGNTAVVMAPWAAPKSLKRMWCMYEMWLSFVSDCRVSIAITKTELGEFLKAEGKDSAVLDKILGNMDITKGLTSSEDDKEMMLAAVAKETGGAAKVSHVLHDELRKVMLTISNVRRIESVDDADQMIAIGYLQKSQGRFQAAEDIYSKCLNVRERDLGVLHPDTLTAMHGMGSLYESTGRLAEAEKAYKGCMEARESSLGLNHPDTLAVESSLGGIYMLQGKLDAAEALYRKSYNGRVATIGPTHPDTLVSMHGLAGVLKARGKMNDSEPIFAKCFELREAQLGKANVQTLSTMYELACVYEIRRKHTKAEALFKRCLETRVSTFGSDHPDTLTSMFGLAGLLKSQRRYAEAEPLYLYCVEWREKKLGLDHVDTLESMTRLANLFEIRGKFEEAEPLYKLCLERTEGKFGANHLSTLAAMSSLASLLYSRERYDEAEPLFTKALEQSAAVLGEDHATTVFYRNNLSALLAQNNSRGKR